MDDPVALNKKVLEENEIIRRKQSKERRKLQMREKNYNAKPKPEKIEDELEEFEESARRYLWL